jgi:hypothetical protein
MLLKINNNKLFLIVAYQYNLVMVIIRESGKKPSHSDSPFPHLPPTEAVMELQGSRAVG